MIFVISFVKNDHFETDKSPYAWINLHGGLTVKKNLFVFVFDQCFYQCGFCYLQSIANLIKLAIFG